MLPLRLTDNQLDTVMSGAGPLHPHDRHKYPQRVAELLYARASPGDGDVARACREAQAAFLTPAAATGRPRKYG